jgi:urea transporter
LAALSVAAVLTWYLRSQADTLHAGLFLFIATLTAIALALGLNVLMYRAALKREWG